MLEEENKVLFKDNIRKVFVDHLHKLGNIKRVENSNVETLETVDLPVAIVWTNTDTIIDDDTDINTLGNCADSRLAVETDILIEVYLACCQAAEQEADLIQVEILKLIFSDEFQDELTDLGIKSMTFVDSQITRNRESETPFTLKSFNFTVKYNLSKLL